MTYASQVFSPRAIALCKSTRSLALFCAIISAALPLHAQTFAVIHNFTGGPDGAYPYAGLTVDAAGNLYGTTTAGGYTQGGCSPSGCGTVFKMKQAGSGWVLTPLFTFGGGPEGFDSQARVVFGPNGTLYGTTTMGGYEDSGLVFNLTPPASACHSVLCPWSEHLLYGFTGRNGLGDGANPEYGDLAFDASGNIYGTTFGGGSGAFGTVFKLSPSGGGWTENILYSFNGPPDGASPFGGVIFDSSGNLYGTTNGGGSVQHCGYYGCGTVYQLTRAGSGWTDTVLYTFEDGIDGAQPYGGVIFGPSGGLYSTTSEGGANNGGTVFQLSDVSGAWQLTTVRSFMGAGAPEAGLVMDSAGNLYGTTLSSVYELTPSGGGWSFTTLHLFNGSDGNVVYGAVAIDANGNLYGTASSGGAYGYGTVWEITP